MARARSHGFTNRGPLRLFMEMTMLFGHAFDTDPQYGWAATILAGNLETPQMARATKLYWTALEFHRNVAGPDHIFKRRALKLFADPAWLAGRPYPGDPTLALSDRIARAYPEKAARVREAALAQLVREALDEASSRGLSASRDQLLFSTLFFVLGHGCTQDLLYPWISQTLDPGQGSVSERGAARLRDETLSWFNRALDSYDKGGRS